MNCAARLARFLPLEVCAGETGLAGGAALRFAAVSVAVLEQLGSEAFSNVQTFALRGCGLRTAVNESSPQGESTCRSLAGLGTVTTYLLVAFTAGGFGFIAGAMHHTVFAKAPFDV